MKYKRGGNSMAQGKLPQIVRAEGAGVFYGIVDGRVGQEVIMSNARRIWYWEGAASLSQLAMEGTTLPQKCKFPCPVAKVHLLKVVEILDTTPEARKSIEAVAVWKA